LFNSEKKLELKGCLVSSWSHVIANMIIIESLYGR